MVPLNPLESGSVYVAVAALTRTLLVAPAVAGADCDGAACDGTDAGGICPFPPPQAAKTNEQAATPNAARARTKNRCMLMLPFTNEDWPESLTSEVRPPTKGN